jgi:hypothetical protein
MLKTDYFVDQPTHTESILDSVLGWTGVVHADCEWCERVWWLLHVQKMTAWSCFVLHQFKSAWFDSPPWRCDLREGRAGKCGVSVVLAALRKGEVWRGFWSADLGFSLCSAAIRMVAHCGTTPLLGWGERVPPMLASWFGWHLRELFTDFDLFFSPTDVLLFLVFILFCSDLHLVEMSSWWRRVVKLLCVYDPSNGGGSAV